MNIRNVTSNFTNHNFGFLVITSVKILKLYTALCTSSDIHFCLKSQKNPEMRITRNLNVFLVTRATYTKSQNCTKKLHVFFVSCIFDSDLSLASFYFHGRQYCGEWIAYNAWSRFFRSCIPVITPYQRPTWSIIQNGRLISIIDGAWLLWNLLTSIELGCLAPSRCTSRCKNYYNRHLTIYNATSSTTRFGNKEICHA